ncbi:UNVERIFIED_CONTAM: hypothetical protein PYX00_003601 [Menopon gallinae]|uniref:Cell cycle checkpoint protein RAD17 n=1 Tax=Menopon gallinae TaxID=328185 RepID=A0AAW2I290_9NEOP
MESQRKGSKKLWKPPSCEDFNVESQCKRIKLDHVELNQIKEDFEDVVISEPRTIDDLATHPKKIDEVKNWLLRTDFLRVPPMLLITGPAGSAKTVTLRVVVSSLNMSLREWVNPMDKLEFKSEFTLVDKSDFSESSQVDKFEDFIFRASRYKSLFDDNEKTVILIEDFPNVFIWKPKMFHEFLERYEQRGKAPIVFICTDDQRLNLSNDLFPSSVKMKHGITEIKFNPVNQSSLMKALKKAVGKCPEKQCPSADVLQSIAQNSNGDLRNALSNVEILMASSKPGKGRRPAKGREKKTAEVVSVKDSRAEFYQALGRVLYPKTITKMAKGGASFENEKRIFLHDVNEIASSFSESFLMLLHENYIDTFSDLKSVCDAADVFTVCDTLHREDELREYAGLVGVIGLMTSNKQPKREGFKPVKKSGAPTTTSKDTWTKRFEYSNFSETCRTLSLDIIPYLKLFKDPKISKRTEDYPEGDAEDFIIEEFDD